MGASATFLKSTCMASQGIQGFQNRSTLRKCTHACVVHNISIISHMSFTNIHHVWPWPPMSSSGSHLSQRLSPHKRERILWLLDDQLTPRLSRICLGIRFMFLSFKGFLFTNVWLLSNLVNWLHNCVKKYCVSMIPNSKTAPRAQARRGREPSGARFFRGIPSVSYTHLTLPTIYSV